jgi:hypothetical protein
MNLTALLAALQGKQWILVGAILVGGLIALLKQGWAGAWFAKVLPPAAIPYVAVVLGAVGLSAAEVIAGKPFAQALIDGIQAGITSVFGHELLVEGIRSGKEIVPVKLPKVAPPTQKEAA